MLTEKEAKTKWCPHVRAHAYVPEGGVSVNRAYPDGVMNIERACCIASACMAWRWAEMPIADESKFMGTVPGTGHCGLAGMP